jgi:hypothetical protein
VLNTLGLKKIIKNITDSKIKIQEVKHFFDQKKFIRKKLNDQIKWSRVEKHFSSFSTMTLFFILSASAWS